jgi:hypothetical protein
LSERDACLSHENVCLSAVQPTCRQAVQKVPSCCVEAECPFYYLGDSGLYMYTKAAAWATVATVATVATPLPMWGGEGSGMVP